MADVPTPVKMVSAIPPGGAPAAQNTPPAKLDNPPRIRSASAAPIDLGVTADPFQGLSYTDILHLRAALATYLTTLATDSVLNADTIARVKQLQVLVNTKLAPTQQAIQPQSDTLINFPLVAPGTNPIPPLPRPTST